MSRNRFGRQQKRHAAERIARLEHELHAARQETRTARAQITGIAEGLANVLGAQSALLPAQKLSIDAALASERSLRVARQGRWGELCSNDHSRSWDVATHFAVQTIELLRIALRGNVERVPQSWELAMHFVADSELHGERLGTTYYVSQRALQDEEQYPFVRQTLLRAATEVVDGLLASFKRRADKKAAEGTL